MKIHLVLFSMLIVSALRAQSLDPKILEEIKVKAKSTHSDALLIRHNGKIIHEEYSSQKQEPIYIASAGKSLVSLAIGRLLKKKQLDSLDQPVWTLFPEWKQGMKKEITIRMLLNHTSGLCPEATGAPNDGSWDYILGHTGDDRTTRLWATTSPLCGTPAVRSTRSRSPVTAPSARARSARSSAGRRSAGRPSAWTPGPPGSPDADERAGHPVACAGACATPPTSRPARRSARPELAA